MKNSLKVISKYFIVMKVDEKISGQRNVEYNGKHLRDAVVLVGQYVGIVAKKVGKPRENNDQTDDEYHFNGLCAIGGEIFAGTLQFALPIQYVFVIVDDEYVDDKNEHNTKHVPVQGQYTVDCRENAIVAKMIFRQTVRRISSNNVIADNVMNVTRQEKRHDYHYEQAVIELE